MNITQSKAHCIRYTANSTQHTAHSKQHTAHCTQHTAHSTLHTAHCTQHTTHSTQDTGHSTLHTAHSTQHTAHSKQDTVHSTLYTAHSTRVAGSYQPYIRLSAQAPTFIRYCTALYCRYIIIALHCTFDRSLLHIHSAVHTLLSPYHYKVRKTENIFML